MNRVGDSSTPSFSLPILRTPSSGSSPWLSVTAGSPQTPGSRSSSRGRRTARKPGSPARRTTAATEHRTGRAGSPAEDGLPFIRISELTEQPVQDQEDDDG